VKLKKKTATILATVSLFVYPASYKTTAEQFSAMSKMESSPFAALPRLLP